MIRIRNNIDCLKVGLSWLASASLMVTVAACGQQAEEADGGDEHRKMLEEREKGNSGGANYGEFGPPDAYEEGSDHPFYGSENVWSRRQFSDRATGLYYKRRGQRQMLAILDGDPAEAVRLADIRIADDPDDAESMFAKTVALTQLGDLDDALASMNAALDAGLPIERFQVGPRELLKPLTDTKEFQVKLPGASKRVLHGPMVGAVAADRASIWVRDRC